MSTPEKSCSFCGKPRSQVRVLVEGKDATICNVCVHRTQAPGAFVAHCDSCIVRNGKHENTCEAESERA